MTQLRIATRSSAQARTQAENIGALIERISSGVSVEYVFVDTHGDVNQTTPLHQMGGQGVFVKEVQRAVLDGAADIAVHRTQVLPPADVLAEQARQVAQEQHPPHSASSSSKPLSRIASITVSPSSTEISLVAPSRLVTTSLGMDRSSFLGLGARICAVRLSWGC